MYKHPLTRESVEDPQITVEIHTTITAKNKHEMILDHAGRVSATRFWDGARNAQSVLNGGSTGGESERAVCGARMKKTPTMSDCQWMVSDEIRKRIY